MSYFKEFFSKNILGEKINPATEDTLQDIKENQTNSSQKVQLVDSDGNNFKTEDNVLRVHHTPHSSPELSVHLTQETAISSTISVEAPKGSRAITITDATGFAVNDKIKIIDGDNSEYDVLKVLNVDGNILTIDRVLDATQIVGKVVKKVLLNMKVNGSVTESVFSYKPRVGEEKRITGIHIIGVTSTEPSIEKFLGILALNRGLHFKVKNDTGRDTTYFIPFRSNSSFILSGFTYQKELKVGGGEYTTHLFIDLERTVKSVIALEENQEFQAIVQDDLTTLTSLEIKIAMYDEKQILDN